MEFLHQIQNLERETNKMPIYNFESMFTTYRVGVVRGMSGDWNRREKEVM